MAAKKKSAPTRRRKSTKTANVATLSLTAEELEFLRDLFSITVAHEHEQTRDAEDSVCQMLAEATQRQDLEGSLWEKIVEACEQNDVSTGNDAPNYSITTTNMPVTQIYRMDD